MQHINSHDFRTSSAQEPHTSAQVAELIEGELVEGAPYSGKELAEELGIADSTLRNRWFPWLLKVAPIELLKTDDGYTELARSLALEFKQVPSKKPRRDRWVAEAKDHYSREFMPDGITPKGVSENLGGALALLRDQGSKLQTAADDQLQQLQHLIESQSQVEAEFDEAEIAAMRATGMKRGVMRFQIETEQEDAAYYQLRKMRSEQRGQSNA